MNDRWLIAQAVAPKWDENQFNRVVWPTAASPYPSAKFTTEEFIRAIVDDVRAKVKIDPRRVILLGWSSGGPPCYAMALRRTPSATGAFIAMSVFRPERAAGAGKRQGQGLLSAAIAARPGHARSTRRGGREGAASRRCEESASRATRVATAGAATSGP